MVNYRIRKVHLKDNSSISTSTKPIIRELLWGLVELISFKFNDGEVINDSDSLTKSDDIKSESKWNLPLSFTSNKKNKSKSKLKRKREDLLLHNLPKCLSPRESNIYMSINNNTKSYCQVIGLGNQDNYFVRLLNDYSCIYVSSSQLLGVSFDDEDYVYELIAEYYSLDINPVENVLDKYWIQRYRLFSLYDKGIKFDEESWYSVTPEVISVHIAHQCLNNLNYYNIDLSDYIVLDLFCGCGGNAIALAPFVKQLIAVDIDPIKVSYCKHNAEVYNVHNKIDFICNDAYKVISNLQLHHEFKKMNSKTFSNESNAVCNKKLIDKHIRFNDDEIVRPIESINKQITVFDKLIDLIILAPPWGGPEYANYDSYDLDTMITSGDVTTLMKESKKLTSNIILIIPKNCCNDQIKQIANFCSLRYCIEDIYLNGRLKLKVVYFGTKLCYK